MKNFKITFAYDGYRFYEVISAETAEDACDYLKHLKGISKTINCEETTEQTELVATQEELEKIRTPFWKKEGAESAEEWSEYQAYWQEIDDKAFQEALKTAPDDWDFEDVAQSYEINVMTFDEWKKSRKN